MKIIIINIIFLNAHYFTFAQSSFTNVCGGKNKSENMFFCQKKKGLNTSLEAKGWNHNLDAINGSLSSVGRLRAPPFTPFLFLRVQAFCL